MNIFDYILIVIISIWLILSLVFIIRQKKKGRHIGCGNCNTCYKNCTKCTNSKTK